MERQTATTKTVASLTTPKGCGSVMKERLRVLVCDEHNGRYVGLASEQLYFTRLRGRTFAKPELLIAKRRKHLSCYVPM